MRAPPATAVHRFEVRPTARAGDPMGESVLRSARSLGVACGGVRTARIYMIEAALPAGSVERLRSRLLADPVLEECIAGAAPARPGERTVEVHPLPGVMDPAAQTVEMMVRELTGAAEVRAATGVRYDFTGLDEAGARTLAERLLANGVIEQARHEPWTPSSFPRPAEADQRLRRVALIGLDDGGLADLSRRGHLFLSPEEMRAVRDHFARLGREPTDIELETIAQTWSEHCVHKTLKSTVRYRSEGAAGDPIRWEGRPGVSVEADGSVVIRNLLKSTVAAATHELIAEGLDWALSVFVDNAGVIAFDDEWGVNVKVETHNRPSAIEPYGGAATGIGGCIRDVIGTGLGARPIAATDVFCVAFPDNWSRGEGAGRALPPGVLHPRRTLTRVVDGVRDYGNRMGIPTVNGAVFFDDRYIGNPLVFCGCIGVLPRGMVRGAAQRGDRVVALGGRTGRDGIHGATFSSAELTETHADEFSHAVQIGNAIEEKRLLDAVLRARDHEGGCLYHAITDCGAGGFSSAVGEMGSSLGAVVDLDRAPLKYASLRYDEIWISESQERMILAVPERGMDALRRICEEESVEMADLGVFGSPGAEPEIVLRFRGEEVGRLSCALLHEGIPMPVREAVWPGAAARGDRPAPAGRDTKERLLSLLSHPTIASKRWIVRQYDHEVQGGTLIKPLVGPGGRGPGDGAVLQPTPGSARGLAVACGMATEVGDPALGGDPYLMALAAVDECVRNLVCVGADPGRIAILDNFCWPSCEKPGNMAALVRACVGCYDAAKAYRTPFISGKDSLNNQFRYRDPETGRETTIEIPPTLLITGVGIVPDVARCVTMDLKPVAGAPVAVLHPVDGALRAAVAAAHAAARMIAEGLVLAAHDASEGGVLTALAEMVLAGGGGAGLEVDAGRIGARGCFGEGTGCYLLQLRPVAEVRASRIAGEVGGLRFEGCAAVTTAAGSLVLSGEGGFGIDAATLREAFERTLDW